MSSKRERITSVDVAREAGVSQATVSYVLNNDPRQTIPEDTRAKVLEAVRKLDYQPYAPARSLRTGQSKVVLVVYQQSSIESGVSRILEEIAEAVGKLGFSLVWQLAFSPERVASDRQSRSGCSDLAWGFKQHGCLVHSPAL